MSTYTSKYFKDGEQLDEALKRASIAASSEEVKQLSENKVNKPASGNGTAGQFLISDGNGGTAWMSLPIYTGEVENA